MVLAVLLVASCSSSKSDEQLAAIVGSPMDPDSLRASVENEALEREEIVAACMRQAGFDYIAWVDPQLLPPGSDPETADLTDREYAAIFGFGLTTREIEVPDIVPNPNSIYFETLPEGEQAAFEIAMNGQLLQDFEIVEVSSSTVGAPGCQQAAFDALTPPGIRPEAVDEYYVLVNEVEDRVRADGRVLDALEEATDCMAQAGFTLTLDASPLEFFYENAERMTGGELPVTFVAMQDMTDQNLAEEVREFERLIAVTSYDCSESLVEVEETVRLELEREMVAENRELLVEVAPVLRTNKDD